MVGIEYATLFLRLLLFAAGFLCKNASASIMFLGFRWFFSRVPENYDRGKTGMRFAAERFAQVVRFVRCGAVIHLYQYLQACRRPFYNKSTFGICSPVIKLYESGTHSSHLREDPHERFTDIIQNSMTDEDSERMSATPDHKRASRKRLRAGHALRY